MGSQRLAIIIGLLSVALLAVAACTSDGSDATRVPTPRFDPTPAGATSVPATPTTVPAAPTATQQAAAAQPTAVPPTAVPPPPAGPAGDPQHGSSVFQSNGCSGCHSTGGDRIVGPGLGGVFDRAGSRVSGLSAEEYVRQSIKEPSAFVVDGFPDNVMPKSFASSISASDLDDLIAYLATLK